MTESVESLWSPAQGVLRTPGTPAGLHMDSTGTPGTCWLCPRLTGISKCTWSPGGVPVESSGVHMEHVGQCKDLSGTLYVELELAVVNFVCGVVSGLTSKSSLGRLSSSFPEM